MRKIKMKNMKLGYVYTPSGDSGVGNMFYCISDERRIWLIQGMDDDDGNWYRPSGIEVKVTQYNEDVVYYEVGNLCTALNDIFAPERKMKDWG